MARWLIAVFVLIIAGLGSYMFHQFQMLSQPEEDTRQLAESAFENERWSEAARHYESLHRTFKDNPDYEFYWRLSSLLRDAGSVEVNTAEVYDRLGKFCLDRQSSPLFAKNHDRIWIVCTYLTQHVLNSGRQIADKSELTPEEANDLEKTLRTVVQWAGEYKQYSPLGQLPAAQNDQFGNRPELQYQKAVHAFVEMSQAKVRPQLRDVESLDLLARNRNMSDDRRVKEALDQLRRRAIPSVEYVAKPDYPVPPPTPPLPTSLLVATPTVTPSAPPPANPGVFFAIVRGVLYALSEHDGRVLWATRVGPDTTQLPVRLPPVPATPWEICLVLASNNSTLTARKISDGTPLWQHHLGTAARGRPLIVERTVRDERGGEFQSRRAYLALVDGRVQEIEIASGRLVGEFRCGELTLTGSGARLAGSNLLFFPADRGYVLVLDVGDGKCRGVIRTGHLSRTLRGDPILVGQLAANNPNAPPCHLVLCQTDGLRGMKLRAFQLPHDWAGQEAVEVQPPAGSQAWRVPGQLWFEPNCDGEKIVLATDTE